MRVVMMGPARGVRGGVSAVVNALLDSLPGDSITVRYIPTHINGPKFLKALVALWGAVRLLVEILFWRPDIVHLHTASRASYRRKSFLAWLAHRLNRRVVVHVHGGEFHLFYRELSPAGRAHVRRTLESADLVIALSEEWRSRLSTIAPKANIRVLVNPVIVSEFEAVIPGRPEVPEDGGTMLFLGAFEQLKGVFDLVEAGVTVAAARPRVVFELGGDREIKELRAHISDRGLEENVRILGWVRGADKLDAFRRAHVFVLPSYREGMPVAVLEALAAGLPVVTTPVGGIPEVIKDGINGILIEPGDTDALAEGILRLLDDKALRKRMAATNVELALRDHDATVVARKLCFWYDDMMSEKEPSG